jgi:pyruvate dehydrogenase E2 component (dihydrolipoamide acetyltransferase)
MYSMEQNERIKFKGLRKVIAKRMRSANKEKPQVTLFADVQVDALMKCKDSLKVSLNPILVKLVSEALQNYPRMNGHVFEDEMVLYPICNIGIAVAQEQGLIVPVLKNVQAKNINQISEEFTDLVERARERKLKSEELADGTFTITNLGSKGIRQFTPIVNPPQIGILGIGCIREEPILCWGEWKTRRMMTLSVSFDHAALDGDQAAEFLQILSRKIEGFNTVST